MAKTIVVSPDRRAKVDQIWADVKANQKALIECEGPHDFVADEQAIGRYRCRKCGGKANVGDVWWYKAGLKHGAIPTETASKTD